MKALRKSSGRRNSAMILLPIVRTFLHLNSTTLRHSLRKYRRAPIRIHNIHDPINPLMQRIRRELLSDHRALCHTIRGFCSSIVWRGMCDEAQGHEDDEQVQPDCDAGNPAVALERADLAEDHANEDPDDDGDDEANAAVGDLVEGLRVGEGGCADVDDLEDGRVRGSDIVYSGLCAAD